MINALFGQLFDQYSHGSGNFFKRGPAKPGIGFFHLAVCALGNSELFGHFRIGYFFIFAPCPDHSFAFYHVGTDNGMGDCDFPVTPVHQIQIFVIRNDGKVAEAVHIADRPPSSLSAHDGNAVVLIVFSFHCSLRQSALRLSDELSPLPHKPEHAVDGDYRLFPDNRIDRYFVCAGFKYFGEVLQ